MATQIHPTGFELRPTPDRELPDGAWWPQTRILTDELGELFALWPSSAGRIIRVLYSPPDWDDRPRSVPVGGRRVKTGCFPRDDTHLITLTTRDGARRSLTVIAPDAAEQTATAVLAGVSGKATVPESSTATGDHPEWDDDGGPT